MRFAKFLRPHCLIAVLCTLVCACAGPPATHKDGATPGAAQDGGQPALAPPQASKTGTPGANVPVAGTAAGGALATPPNTDAGPVLSPAVLQAFDAALRALQAGRWAEAERGFLALTKTNPELGGPHANLGIIYRHADKIAQAVAELEQAVHANPQQPIYWNQLGIAYRHQGQFGKSREAYERAIALDPGYSAANLNLGILFDLYLWDSKRALEHYDRYLALSPGGDEKVTKWVADLKNRNREHSALSRREQE
jgi:tetratricopeptide (TPR) repeat protein